MEKLGFVSFGFRPPRYKKTPDLHMLDDVRVRGQAWYSTPVAVMGSSLGYWWPWRMEPGKAQMPCIMPSEERVLCNHAWGENLIKRSENQASLFTHVPSRQNSQKQTHVLLQCLFLVPFFPLSSSVWCLICTCVPCKKGRKRERDRKKCDGYHLGKHDRQAHSGTRIRRNSSHMLPVSQPC